MRSETSMPATIFKRATEGQDLSCARSSGSSSRGSDTSRFDPIVRTAHWLTLFLILGVYATALLMHRLPVPLSLTLQLHRSFGLTVWLASDGAAADLAPVFPLSGLACKHVTSHAMGSQG